MRVRHVLAVGWVAACLVAAATVGPNLAAPAHEQAARAAAAADELRAVLDSPHTARPPATAGEVAAALALAAQEAGVPDASVSVDGDHATVVGHGDPQQAVALAAAVAGTGWATPTTVSGTGGQVTVTAALARWQEVRP